MDCVADGGGDVMTAKTVGESLTQFFRELLTERFDDAAVAEDYCCAFVE